MKLTSKSSCHVEAFLSILSKTHSESIQKVIDAVGGVIEEVAQNYVKLRSFDLQKVDPTFMSPAATWLGTHKIDR